MKMNKKNYRLEIDRRQKHCQQTIKHTYKYFRIYFYVQIVQTNAFTHGDGVSNGQFSPVCTLAFWDVQINIFNRFARLVANKYI